MVIIHAQFFSRSCTAQTPTIAGLLHRSNCALGIPRLVRILARVLPFLIKFDGKTSRAYLQSGAFWDYGGLHRACRPGAGASLLTLPFSVQDGCGFWKTMVFFV
jgi:hypothetical protein